jgi:Homeodomain-like domain
MSDQFQHVMVLTSIIIGLGITNVLLGVSGAIERYTEGDRPLQLSWASAFWLAQVFPWMILFWWWEFRLVDILKHGTRTVEYWIKRFNAEGLSGLVEGERPGRPTRLSEAQLEHIGVILRESPRAHGMMGESLGW